MDLYRLANQKDSSTFFSRRRERRRIDKIQKAVQYLHSQTGKESLKMTRDQIITNRVNTVFIDGILFVVRGMDQGDYWKGLITYQAYDEIKNKKVADSELKAAEKNLAERRKLEEKFISHMEDIFTVCIIYPELSASEIANNQSISGPLYQAIISTTFPQKKK